MNYIKIENMHYAFTFFIVLKLAQPLARENYSYILF